MSSKSSTVRRPTYIAQTRLQTRRICLRSSATLRRSCRPRSAKSARASTNDGRVYGPVVEEYVRHKPQFLSLMLPTVSSQRGPTIPGEVPPVPDWMSDLAQQTGMSDGAKEVAERDARWISDFSDQLTVAIALREWDTAVDLVEQGNLSPLFITCR